MNNYIKILMVCLVALFYTNAHAQVDKLNKKTTAMLEKSESGKMQIDIWSDVLCPFCYIGKRKLEAALEQFEHRDEIEIIWHSYQLDPEANPTPGVDIYDYLAERKGQSREWSVNAHRQVTMMAKEAGLHYDFDKVVVSNSFNAHRLIQWAKTKEKDDEVEELLFKAHFTEGKDINNRVVLSDIAAAAGLDRNEALEILNTTAFTNEVRTDVAAGESLGLTGVPFFVFARKYAISGAQPVSSFLKALQLAYKDYLTQ